MLLWPVADGSCGKQRKRSFASVQWLASSLIWYSSVSLSATAPSADADRRCTQTHALASTISHMAIECSRICVAESDTGMWTMHSTGMTTINYYTIRSVHGAVRTQYYGVRYGRREHKRKSSSEWERECGAMLAGEHFEFDRTKRLFNVFLCDGCQPQQNTENEIELTICCCVAAVDHTSSLISALDFTERNENKIKMNSLVNYFPFSYANKTY